MFHDYTLIFLVNESITYVIRRDLDLEGLAMSICVDARYNLVEVTDDWHCVATPNEERVFFALIERVINIYVHM